MQSVPYEHCNEQGNCAKAPVEICNSIEECMQRVLYEACNDVVEQFPSVPKTKCMWEGETACKSDMPKFKICVKLRFLPIFQKWAKNDLFAFWTKMRKISKSGPQDNIQLKMLAVDWSYVSQNLRKITIFADLAKIGHK